MRATYPWSLRSARVALVGETFVEENSRTEGTPYLFTGKELGSETGLYYFGARYYDPRTSVWASPDPILASYMGGSGSGRGVYTPPNLNIYGYVQQRPLIAVDPNGEETYITVHEPATAGGVGVIDIVVTAAWNNGNRQNFHISDAKLEAAFEAQSGVYSGVQTPSNKSGGKYQVNFDFQFVADNKTSYDIVVNSDPKYKYRENVDHRPGQGANDKIMTLKPNSSAQTFAHEGNHFAGAEDQYDRVSGKVFNGYEGNSMGQLCGGCELDGRNITDMISGAHAQTSQSRADLRAGVFVNTSDENRGAVILRPSPGPSGSNPFQWLSDLFSD